MQQVTAGATEPGMRQVWATECKQYALHTCSMASPTPSQTGRWKRVCVQAKIQGMARSVSMPPPVRRLAGREPMFIAPSSATGVAFWKYLQCH
jgi:hypothetical protein